MLNISFLVSLTVFAHKQHTEAHTHTHKINLDIYLLWEDVNWNNVGPDDVFIIEAAKAKQPTTSIHATKHSDQPIQSGALVRTTIRKICLITSVQDVWCKSR